MLMLTSRWKKWDETIPELVIPQDAQFSNIHPMPLRNINVLLNTLILTRWKKWDDTIPELVIPPDAQFSNIIIPTKDSARCGL